MSGVLTYAQLMLKNIRAGRTIPPEELEKKLSTMEKETERCTRIIKSLLEFSRQSRPSIRPIDLAKSIDNAMIMLTHQAELSNVRIVKQYGSIPQIEADPDQLQQVFTNIILNAIHAMTKGGTLTISTVSDKPKGLMGVRFQDTGTGITPENLKKLFTPFFTTKEKGVGIGLGLAVCYGIIQRHDGDIKVKSELGKGTGKELVARAVHVESLRHKGPFVSLNCAALPESLLESELFGHEKGAFTGAIAQKKGKFELANNGTIFLDEIGDISPNVQVHLLRVLQEKELSRVGGNEIVKVDVRVVTSTNRDLKKRVAEGKFREDLFYRLNVVPIYVPPLRERPDDIPILARYFLKKFNTENNKNIRDFSPEVLEYFMKHPWTGNVRELENAIEYSVVLCHNEIIKPEHLPPLLKDRQVCEPQPSATSNKVSLKDTEKEQIIKTLGETEWNYTRTAKTLGISRSTLHNKLKEYQIEKR